MPNYSYIALNESGRRIKGRITAANEIDLEDRLKNIGLDVIDCKEVREGRIELFSKIEAEDIIILCIHLEQLERAGVPILDSISDIRNTTENPAMKSLMEDIYEDIKNGSLLSAALARHPKVFNQVFTGLVAAGEKTGNLAEVFSHLSKHLKWVNNLRRRIKKATYYPIFLLFLMSGIIMLMMLFVIPKLSTFLKAQNFELPFYTKALIATSDFFSNYWYLVVIAPFAIIGIIKFLAKISDDIAYNIDIIKLHIPFIGSVIRKIEIARFSHFFAITYRSGLGIIDCLEVAHNVVKNRAIRENIATVKKSVTEGSSLTESLKVSNQFPNLVIRMFKVGEESGNLDVTLENINFFYDREVNDSVNNMVGVIQPALTIIMGAIMLWVSLAVFGPLYNSFSNMNLG